VLLTTKLEAWEVVGGLRVMTLCMISTHYYTADIFAGQPD
jgi:hypothetical protein